MGVYLSKCIEKARMKQILRKRCRSNMRSDVHFLESTFFDKKDFYQKRSPLNFYHSMAKFWWKFRILFRQKDIEVWLDTGHRESIFSGMS